MYFKSTRNPDLLVSFSQATHDCIPEDGGVFVPSDISDLRRWVSFIDETTPFTSVAGALTSALMSDEYSPIICETIATKAFPVAPVVRQLEDNLFFMELYHGFTGYHRDYGVSYLVSYLEYTLQLTGGKTVFLDYTNGSLGAILSRVLKGKKNIKAVLVYKKGSVLGIDEESLAWNGGNIYPVEMDLPENEIKDIVRSIFKDRKFIKQYGVTVANTTNICRLLSQLFFFPYAFAQIKNKVDSDIYFAMDSGNYGTLMAGLYSWRFALPVSGFLVPSTPALFADMAGNPQVLDSVVSLEKRGIVDPTAPANLERLENFFENNEAMMKHFVKPVEISERQREKAAKELYMNYGIFADKETAAAYAVVKEERESVFDEDGVVVLMAYNDPALSSDYCRHVLGEVPEMNESVKKAIKPVELGREYLKSSEEIKDIIRKLYKK